ncbi:MAG: U32 family peptidase [Desulfobacula sp.]|nr:U32 family peptidase [Desulfobacula sp.]
MQPLELLSPAKNRELGMAAVNHGADAVYIGAAGFSARAAAGNAIHEIEKLAVYAHFYKAKIYIALNTLIFDRELEEVQKLIRHLWNAGADALIIQDLGILELDLPPIPLFASTQLDNRTVDRVRFLESAGFERVILARELSLREIKEIRRNTGVDLETFVHGALCACYSGRCYFSAAIGKRSANRGQCGQPCRLSWTLMNVQGHVLERDRHLLSLKDMNRSDYLYDLVEAGVTSFKIEGRLKDMAYVKNITAHYRKRLDDLLAGSSGYRAPSSGRTELFFIPDPLKTFNRGETDYFLSGRKGDIQSLNTPKSLGEKIGIVDQVESRYFTLKGSHDLHNGDGLCFINPSGKLEGFQVNRVDGDKIFPAGLQDLKKGRLLPGAIMYRNHDHVFQKKLAGPSSERKIALDLSFIEIPQGFALEGRDEDGNEAEVWLETEKIQAKDGDLAFATLKKQLTRLGESPFYLRTLNLPLKPYFVVTRELNRIRRELLEILSQNRHEAYVREPAKQRPDVLPFPGKHLDFTTNVANSKALEFYRKRGVKTIDPAFELSEHGPGTVVMTLRHCILWALGQCRREVASVPEMWKDPLSLENKSGRFQLEFDCIRCEMRIKTL